MYIQNMRETYSSPDDHDPINFVPIARLDDPVHIAGEPGDRVYSLQVLLTRCNGKNPCTRADLNPAEFEPLVAPNLLKRNFLKTIRTLANAGWTNIEEVERDMAQLPVRRLNEHHLRSNDWPEVAAEYARILSERPGQELTISQRIFRLHGFERMEAIRTLVLRPLHTRRSRRYRARRDLALLNYFNETELTLGNIYHANLLGPQQRRVRAQLVPDHAEPGRYVTIDILATQFVLMRCRLFEQYINVLMDCGETLDEFQFIAERFESTRGAAQDRAALQALLDARLVKAYTHGPLGGWSHYIINPMTPQQVLLYGLACASPELHIGMIKSAGAWVLYLLRALETHRKVYPTYSSACLKRFLPALQDFGTLVFRPGANGGLILEQGFDEYGNQHIFMSQLDALEANDMDAPSINTTKYAGIARCCDETREDPS